MHLIHVYGKKYERGSNWSEPEVLELLQIWSDVPVQTELVTCLRNQHVFNRIASTLRQKGINRTGDQCREKIKKLKLEYKQKTLRSARYYELMERAQSNRSAATSGSTLPLWGGTVTNQVTGMQGSEAPGHPPRAGEILEIKTEVMSSDDEAVGPSEMLYEFGPVDEDDEAGAAEHKHAGPNTEESTEMDGEQGNTHVICSPSGILNSLLIWMDECINSFGCVNIDTHHSATETKHHLHDVLHRIHTFHYKDACCIDR